MCAVLARETTDKGQHVDVSSYECFANNYWWWLPTVFFGEGGPSRTGGAQWAPVATLLCKDGYVSFQFQTEEQWQGLVETMGNPDWAESEFTLQQILGHSTLAMVGRYVNLASNDIAIQHQRFSPLDRINLRGH